MAFWKWLRRAPPVRHNVPYLFDQPHWRVHHVTDLVKFFATLPRLVPAKALVGLADGSWSNETRAILEDRRAEMGEDDRQRLPSEFRQAPFVPLTTDNIIILGDLAETHAEPEIASHLAVVFDGRSILEWYDLPDDPITIARFIQEAQILGFADAIGGTLESGEPRAHERTTPLGRAISSRSVVAVDPSVAIRGIGGCLER